VHFLEREKTGKNIHLNKHNKLTKNGGIGAILGHSQCETPDKLSVCSLQRKLRGQGCYSSQRCNNGELHMPAGLQGLLRTVFPALE
jgi:hypothetical protein